MRLKMSLRYPALAADETQVLRLRRPQKDAACSAQEDSNMGARFFYAGRIGERVRPVR